MLFALFLTAVSAEKGCCYDVGFGAMMVECCQSMNEEAHSGGLMMVEDSECNAGGRMGGATKFEAGKGCDEMEWYEEPEKEDDFCICTMDYTPVCGKDGKTYSNACAAGCKKVAVDYKGECNKDGEPKKGCCYNVGFGAMMVECCQSMTDAHSDGLLMVEESACNTEGLVGGATKFAEGKGCDEMEWYEPPVKKGCCYDVGFGAMMAECCQSATDAHDGGLLMVEESACKTGNRMGGATKFAEGQGCDEFEWYEEASAEAPEKEERGCCYNVGYGAMMVECCQSTAGEHSTHDWMMNESECATEGRMGGSTKFAKGSACTDFEWASELEVDEFESFSQYQVWCKTMKSEEACKCGKWKERNGKGRCVPPKKTKQLKCKKIKGDSNLCKRVGCDYEFKKGKGKCKGKTSLE